MINNVTTKYGESFQGVGAYVLHDKRSADLEERHKHTLGIDTSGQTSNRVAWAITQNLATKDAKAAINVMSFYALEREKILQRYVEEEYKAGRRKTNYVAGRKAKPPVAHISFSWHPEQSGEITPEQMQDFAKGALKVLGFENQQAVIVCHNDEPQPHIHLIVSRIDPKTGKMVNCYYDQRKLSRYAEKYVASLGKEYCPNRKKNRLERERQRRKSKEARIAIRDESLSRNLQELKTAAVNDNSLRGRLLDEQRASAAEILAARDALYQEQDDEWDRFETKYQRRIEDIQSQTSKAIRTAGIDGRKASKEALRRLDIAHIKRQMDFAENEKRAFGRLRNILQLDHRTLFAQYDLLRKQAGRSPLQAVYKIMGDDASIRLRSFKRQLDEERSEVQRRREEAEKDAIRQIKKEAADALENENKAFLIRRERLLDRHDAQEQQIQAAWKAHNQRFDAEWSKIRVADDSPDRDYSGEAEALAAKLRRDFDAAMGQRRGRGR